MPHKINHLNSDYKLIIGYGSFKGSLGRELPY